MEDQGSDFFSVNVFRGSEGWVTKPMQREKLKAERAQAA